jgi:hypothetical protein
MRRDHFEVWAKNNPVDAMLYLFDLCEAAELDLAVLMGATDETPEAQATEAAVAGVV